MVETPRRNAAAKWLPLVVITAGVLPYLNSFSGDFVFDDTNNIVENERIRQLWPPEYLLASRRPVVEVSLALNYALGQLDVWGYHAFNLLVHVLAGLTLFGVVRRTLLRESLRDRWGRASPCLALAVAVVWLVHPLQTESVTYIIQRGESLMGLFYLLTLYCVIRGVDSPHPHRWSVAAVVACALGMGSKAVMATAPIVVLFYDRTFLSGSFLGTLRKRWGLYCGLMATWLVLGACGVVQALVVPSERAETVGFTFTGVSPLEYALTQAGVILHYLRLSFWPHPLCLDYGPVIGRTAGITIVGVLVVAALLAATAGTFVRKAYPGFLGVWFFFILAPTSSFVPIKDPIFEHRMYLPLAAVAAFVVIVGHRVLEHLLHKPLMRRAVAVGLVIAVAGLLSYRTARRNEDYRSPVAMWTDIVARRPSNARAHYNLGYALARRRQREQAIPAFREALRIQPDYPRAYNSLGIALAKEGRIDESIAALKEAVRTGPGYARIHNNLGNALRQRGRLDEALRAYREAVSLRRRYPEAYSNLCNALTARGRLDEAVQACREALRLRPEYPEAHANLGVALAAQGKIEQAVREYQEALRLKPGDARIQRLLNAVLTDKRSTERP